VVEAPVAQQVVDAPGRAGFLVPGTEHDPGDACREDRPGAQHARLEGHDEGRVGEVPVGAKFRRTANRDDLRMGGRIVGLLALVPAVREHRAAGIQDHCSDRHVAGREGEFGFREREAHRGEVGGRVGRAEGLDSIDPMRLHVADHPLITHKLTVLRDKTTPSPTFRALVEELVTLLAYEATRNVRTEVVQIETPVAVTNGLWISEPRPLVVPILRAGLGMLEGMVKLLPTAEVGFLGMMRDEETLKPTTYANRLPDDLSDRQCFVLDPMLATGGSLIAAIEFLFERGAVDVTAVCLIGSPEGVKAVEAAFEGRDVTIVLGALDQKLNEVGYIVPGLGDAGDRLYGLV
jgi:uracil phosphoribosyltransferase